MLKQGDTVTVRSDLRVGLYSCGVCCVTSGMLEYAGKQLTITSVFHTHYRPFPVYKVLENPFTWSFGFMEESVKPYVRLTPDLVLHCFRRLGLEPTLEAVKGPHVLALVASYFGGFSFGPLNDQRVVFQAVKYLTHFYPVDYLCGVYTADDPNFTQLPEESLPEYLAGRIDIQHIANTLHNTLSSRVGEFNASIW